MGAPILNGPFVMPMFREIIPRKIQPWIYVFFAFTFQLSGGLYLGALNQMIGGMVLMREDILMCLYCNLAGMAIYFPLLFRAKFRFTNKTLLTAAATGVLVCNLVAPHITFLPLLWAVCFVEGICKIQGTFECMSNIQLWMTPKRDFTVFFPLLHIVILCSMQFSDLLMTFSLYYYHWSYMHLFIAALMMVDLLLLHLFIRPFHFLKKRLPLFGIDWLGALLWSALLLQIAYLLDYGDWYDWWNSPVVRRLSLSIAVTLTICLWRMFTIRHPFYEPKMWTYRHLFPLFVLIALVEAFLASERVLEEIFSEEVMHYEEMVSVQLDWLALVGIVAGCLFSLWWMHVRKYNYIRLLIVGIVALLCYLLGFYFTIDSNIHISQLYLPVMCRGFAYAVLSATFMVCLEEIMTFQHFFQALSVFNMLHMVIGGVVGAALYTQGFSYYLQDNIARYGSAVDRVSFSRAPFPLEHYMESFISQMMEISIKQIYGWIVYACAFLLLLFLLYDIPARRQMKLMPAWKQVAKDVKNSFWRTRHKPEELLDN